MKVPFAVVLCTVLLQQTSVRAWVSAPRSGFRLNRLYSLAPAERESGSMDLNSVDTEVQSGKVLEGGKVVDFSAVKASDEAEDALANARKEITHATSAGAQTSEILGINSDVIAEVGHELAQFATPQEIQGCATWIRASAPSGLFEPKEGVSFDASPYSETQIDRFRNILLQSFEEAGEVTSAFAKTFYMGTMLLGEEAREAIWAIYVWCRRTDEIVDAPRDSNDEMLRDLSLWELRLENLWAHGEVVDVYDLTLLQVLAKYPTLDKTPFMDMIRGMLMDVPGLGRDRYDLFDELHLYCYRVAGTVGLMSLPVFGCAPGFTDETARYVLIVRPCNF